MSGFLGLSKMTRVLTTLFLALCGVLSVESATAHSFKLGFIAPLSGPESRLGKEALDAFLFATGERDSHPGEKSDGHLGGLDSYVIRIDSAQGVAFVQGRIRVLSADRIPFITGVFTPEIANGVIAAFSGTQPLLVDPLDCGIYRASAGMPDRLSTVAGARFSEVFKAKYGYDPGAYAARGYIAARLIAATVRAVGDKISDRSALKSAFEEICNSALTDMAR